MKSDGEGEKSANFARVAGYILAGLTLYAELVEKAPISKTLARLVTEYHEIQSRFYLFVLTAALQDWGIFFYQATLPMLSVVTVGLVFGVLLLISHIRRRPIPTFLEQSEILLSGIKRSEIRNLVICAVGSFATGLFFFVHAIQIVEDFQSAAQPSALRHIVAGAIIVLSFLMFGFLWLRLLRPDKEVKNRRNTLGWRLFTLSSGVVVFFLALIGDLLSGQPASVSQAVALGLIAVTVLLCWDTILDLTMRTILPIIVAVFGALLFLALDFIVRAFEFALLV